MTPEQAALGLLQLKAFYYFLCPVGTPLVLLSAVAAAPELGHVIGALGGLLVIWGVPPLLRRQIEKAARGTNLAAELEALEEARAKSKVFWLRWG